MPQVVGKSFLPLLTRSDDQIHHQPIFWEKRRNTAVRMGDYKSDMKLKKGQPEVWELYKIAKDRTDLNDLSEAEPEIFKNLTQAWEQWANTHQVQPWQTMLDSLHANQLRSRKE